MGAAVPREAVPLWASVFGMIRAASPVVCRQRLVTG